MRQEYRLRAGGIVAAVIILLLLVAPLLVLIVLGFSGDQVLIFPPRSYSLHWLSTVLTSPDWLEAAKTSVALAVASTVVAVLVGTPTALGMARGRIGRWRVVQALVAAPIIVPILSLAIGIYFIAAYLKLLRTLVPLISAETVYAIPLVVVAVMAAESTMDRRVEVSARTLGASPRSVLLRITLPMIAPGVVAGAVFSFVNGWGDLTNPIFLGSPEINPLPLQLWNSISYGLSPVIASASVLLFAGSLLVVGLASVLLLLWRRRMSRGLMANIVVGGGAKDAD